MDLCFRLLALFLTALQVVQSDQKVDNTSVTNKPGNGTSTGHIQCIVCSSKKPEPGQALTDKTANKSIPWVGDECVDVGVAKAKHTQNCPQSSVGCYKIVQAIDHDYNKEEGLVKEERIVRSCATKPSKSLKTECQKRTLLGTSSLQCFCKGDNCNPGIALYAQASVVITTCVLLLISYIM